MLAISSLRADVISIPLLVYFGRYAIAAIGTFDKSMPVCELPFPAVLGISAAIQCLLYAFSSSLIDKWLVLAFVYLSPLEDFADIKWMMQ